MKTLKSILFAAFIIGIVFIIYSCATTGSSRKIPTLSFTQYGLEPGPLQTQEKSDISISLEVIRISDIYDYPDLFSFSESDFPQYQDNYIFKSQYPIGPLGKKWEFPFATPDGKEQLLLCWAKIRNETDHILRMGDARIYLVVEGKEPVLAFDNPQPLFERAKYFERRTNEEMQANIGPFSLNVSLPPGFYPGLVRLHSDFYKLINDLNKEILPDFTYEGLLVFPVVPTTSSKAQISFFDVTTKTDAAGNPIEKTTFNFHLVHQKVSLWFNKYKNRWDAGTPPV